MLTSVLSASSGDRNRGDVERRQEPERSNQRQLPLSFRTLFANEVEASTPQPRASASVIVRAETGAFLDSNTRENCLCIA